MGAKSMVLWSTKWEPKRRQRVERKARQRRLSDAELRRINRGLALIGKRVRVWYASVRKWRVARVKSLLLLEKHTRRADVLFQLVRSGRTNPYYYAREELRLIRRRAHR